MPYTEDKGDITSCGVPQKFDASKEFADKKVVLFAVPGQSAIRIWKRYPLLTVFMVLGAFTPGCSARHLPPYIENLSKIKSKGVDLVIVIAYNDAWVMSAWGKANNVRGDDIVSCINRNRMGSLLTAAFS